VAAALVELLTDRDRARAMGAAGRAWMRADWHWSRSATRLAELLRPDQTYRPDYHASGTIGR
jgi:phosphatidyl-myo-inositol dimannoside synthase